MEPIRGLVYVTQFGQNDKTPHESTRFAGSTAARPRSSSSSTSPTPEVRGRRPESCGHCSSDRSTFELMVPQGESAYIVESLAKGQDEATKVQFLANVGRPSLPAVRDRRPADPRTPGPGRRQGRRAHEVW